MVTQKTLLTLEVGWWGKDTSKIQVREIDGGDMWVRLGSNLDRLTTLMALDGLGLD